MIAQQPGFDTQNGPNAGATPTAGAPAPTATTFLPVVRSFGPITFDAVVSEGHTSEQEVTTQPMENGSSMADHAYMKPRTLKIQAIVSDVFFGNPAGDLYSQNSSNSRSRNGWAFLRQLQTQHTLLTVVTGLDVYENMLITALNTEQNVGKGRVLLVDISLTEVLIVSSQSVAFSGVVSSGTVNNGNKPGTPVPAPSYLKQALG